jgi:hypothetical protein
MCDGGATIFARVQAVEKEEGKQLTHKVRLKGRGGSVLLPAVERGGEACHHEGGRRSCSQPADAVRSSLLGS